MRRGRPEKDIITITLGRYGHVKEMKNPPAGKDIRMVYPDGQRDVLRRYRKGGRNKVMYMQISPSNKRMMYVKVVKRDADFKKLVNASYTYKRNGKTIYVGSSLEGLLMLRINRVLDASFKKTPKMALVKKLIRKAIKK